VITTTWKKKKNEQDGTPNQREREKNLQEQATEEKEQ
jgi:hypothetical protein